jgi:murein L,D-transpeptidase YcbB/YkuD
LPGPSLRRGDRSPRVPDLRRRLRLSGDLNGPFPTDVTIYDRHLETAMMRFQHRHGLDTDGVIGKQTVAALSVSVDDRIRQLQLNMERWRWYPHPLGPRYLMVNIPDYTLSIVKKGWVIRRMRAIVGRAERQTPVLSGRMTYLDLNPYWNIPRKIAREDILPRILEDPAYLDRQGIQVFAGWQPDSAPIDPWRIDWTQLSRAHFPYRLRQDPSSLNALGRIKFMFPNRQSIYIHDTPGRSLFNRAQRSFSAGCVRVDRPMELAAYLLKEQGWHPLRLKTAIASGRQRAVILRQPVDVFLVYFTAWVDDAGKVHFRNDVYGRDRSLQLAIDQRSGPQLRYPIDEPRSRLLASNVIYSR